METFKIQVGIFLDTCLFTLNFFLTIRSSAGEILISWRSERLNVYPACKDVHNLQDFLHEEYFHGFFNHSFQKNVNCIFT